MRIFIALTALLVLGACSVEQGGRLFQPTPSGAVQLRLVGGSSSVIASGPNNPVTVHNGFSVYVNEPWYTNYFTAKVVSYTAPATGPCYAVPAQANNTVLTFTVQRQISTQGTGKNVCHPGNGDVEGIRVSDIYGNATTQYFKNK